MDELSAHLIEEDRKASLPVHPEVKRIQLAIENVLKTILSCIADKDKRLKGKLLPLGSYYADLKIGFPDEFDFLYELETFVEGKNFEIRPSGFMDIRNLWRTPNGNPLKKKVQIKTPEDYFNKENENSSSNWLHKINGGFVLSPVGVKTPFMMQFTMKHRTLTIQYFLGICHFTRQRKPHSSTVQLLLCSLFGMEDFIKI